MSCLLSLTLLRVESYFLSKWKRFILFFSCLFIRIFLVFAFHVLIFVCCFHSNQLDRERVWTFGSGPRMCVGHKFIHKIIKVRIITYMAYFPSFCCCYLFGDADIKLGPGHLMSFIFHERERREWGEQRSRLRGNDARVCSALCFVVAGDFRVCSCVHLPWPSLRKKRDCSLSRKGKNSVRFHAVRSRFLTLLYQKKTKENGKVRLTIVPSIIKTGAAMFS